VSYTRSYCASLFLDSSTTFSKRYTKWWEIRGSNNPKYPDHLLNQDEASIDYAYPLTNSACPTRVSLDMAHAAANGVDPDTKHRTSSEAEAALDKHR